MKYWSEESKNPAVVIEIVDGLKIPANCIGVRVPMLNEAVAKNRKIVPFRIRAEIRLSDIQKGLVFATSAVLKIADEMIWHRMKTGHLTSGSLWVTLLILLL